MAGPTRNSPLKKLLVFVVVLVGALAAAEIGLRLTGYEFYLYPRTIEFGYPNPKEKASQFVDHDRLLWVEPDYPEEVAAAIEERPPLVLMGCSCTAWGRFDEGLARRVAERRDGAELHFSNLAFPGWSSFQGRQQMELDTVRIRPKVVTIFYGWNDHWIGFGVDDATAAELNQSFLYPLQRFRLVQFVNEALVATADESPEKPRRVSPEQFRDNLARMVELARGIGATPVLLTAPTAHRKGSEPAYLERRWLDELEDLVPLHQQYAQIVREVARETDAVLCDLLAASEELSPEELEPLFRDDGIHFEPPGDEWVAEHLYACLDDAGLIDVLIAD